MSIKGPIRLERIIAIILLLGFIVYGLFEAFKLLSGPKVDIVSPQSGSTIDSPTVIIEGKTRNISFISLNDRQIFIDDKGVFRDKLLLPEGYTIIKIVAEDRFKKRVEERIALWRPYSAENGHASIEELKNATTTFATSTDEEILETEEDIE